MAESSESLRVVLVEDSAVMRDILAGLLSRVAPVVMPGFAEGEAEAAQLLEQAQPDLAIVDLELKQGSGIGLLGRIRAEPARFGSPAVVVFSNHAHPRIQQRCLSLGALAFFDKAFQMDELLTFVRGIVGRQGPNGG